MQHRYVIKAVDRTLHDIRKNDRPFGGITFVMSGDFRQILPVVCRGGRADAVNACIKSSPLWRFVKILKLTTNMRVLQRRAANALDTEIRELDDYAEFFREIGDGRFETHPDLGQDVVELPKTVISNADNIRRFIDEIYPELETKATDVD